MSELELVKLFCILFWCHILLDYALQGDFMSRAKNPFLPPGQATHPFPGVPPFLILFQHAFLQAGPRRVFHRLVDVGLVRTRSALPYRLREMCKSYLVLDRPNSARSLQDHLDYLDGQWRVCESSVRA